MAWLPAIATIAASIFASEGQQDTNDTNLQIQQNNSAFNAEQAAINRQFQSQEAATQRNFQQQNSDTVWQRGVRDMQAAGLNPMLAYSQGGNPSPVGAAGSGSQASAGGPGNMQNPYAAAGASAGQWAQIENTMADTKTKEAQAEYVKAQTDTERGRPANLAADTERIRADAELKIRQGDLTDTQNKQAQAEIQKIFASTANIDADTLLKRVNTVLQKYDIPRMEAEAKYFKSPVGRESPHNKYGPQTPFRFLEGLGERIINRSSAPRYDTPDVGQKYHPSGRIR